jgi:hypothetical protein
VNLVGTGLGHYTDDAAAVASVFGGVVAGQKAEFGDRIGIGIQKLTVIQQIIVEPTVEKVRNRISASAGDAEIARCAVVVVALGDSGLQQGQVKNVAAVQGHIDQLPAGHRLAQSCIHGLDGGCVRLDIERLTCGPHFHLQVNAQRLIDQKLVCIADDGAKSFMIGSYFVVSNGEREDLERAIPVRHGRPRQLRRHVGYCDSGFRYDRTLLVVNRTNDPSGRTFRLFENPGHGNDWITLKLVGVKTNRPAIGARIKVTVENKGEGTRSIYRTVTSGGSFGSSPLQQHIGLGKDARIVDLEIWWPTSNTRQHFANVDKNQFLEIKEFAQEYAKLERKPYRLGGAKRDAAVVAKQPVVTPGASN